MARIRCIKPEFFTSADILSLTPLARLFYISLWCEADREGRLRWDTQTLKFRYVPKDDCNIDELAQELVSQGLIEVYEVDGKLFSQILSFQSHQIINNRESPSTLPPRVKVASPRVKAEGKEGREGKGKEPASFDSFWQAYPKKAGKADAEKSWGKLDPDDALQNRILKAVATASKSPDWTKENGQFIPHPATWLNGRRWEDVGTILSVVAGNDPRFMGAK